MHKKYVKEKLSFSLRFCIFEAKQTARVRDRVLLLLCNCIMKAGKLRRSVRSVIFPELVDYNVIFVFFLALTDRIMKTHRRRTEKLSETPGLRCVQYNCIAKVTVVCTRAAAYRPPAWRAVAPHPRGHHDHLVVRPLPLQTLRLLLPHPLLLRRRQKGS